MKTIFPANRLVNNVLGIIALIACTGVACKKGMTEQSVSPQTDAATAKTAAVAAAQTHTYAKIFDGGTDEYHSYRIPSLVRTNANTLLAFVERRMSANSDYGNINVEYKRSTDN